jgi:hypothetical protein
MEDSMPTISQIEALSDIFEAASPKIPFEKFDSLDKELFSMGVRVGQQWRVCTSKANQNIAIIGYTRKGFSIISVEYISGNNTSIYAKYVTTPSICKKLIRDKLALETNISQEDIYIPYLSKAPPSTLLDDHGLALPGNEIDVALHAFGMEEVTWLSPISGEQQYLYCCENGHYICSNKFSDKFMIPCGPECWELKSNPELRFYMDNILGRLVNGKTLILSESPIRNIGLGELAMASYSPIRNFDRIKQLLINIPKANALGIPAFKMENAITGKFKKISDELKSRKVKSGDVFSLASNNLHVAYAKFHFRDCGGTHIELSDTKIFTNTLDDKIMNKISSMENIRIRMNASSSIDINATSGLIRCPICRTAHEFIISPHDEIRFRKSKPISMDIGENDTETITIGSFVRYRKVPMIVYKLQKNPDGIDRAIVMDAKSKLTTVYLKSLKSIKPTADILDLFYDDNNILKKKVIPDRWHELILQGARLRVRDDVEDEEKKRYRGMAVTVMGTPARLSDTEWGVKVIEAEEIFNLNRELLPLNTRRIIRGEVLCYKGNDFIVSSVKDGYVHMADSNQIFPEAVIQLLLNRSQIVNKEIYTVDSLL